MAQSTQSERAVRALSCVWLENSEEPALPKSFLPLHLSQEAAFLSCVFCSVVGVKGEPGNPTPHDSHGPGALAVTPRPHL